MKPEDHTNLEHLVVLHNTQARMTLELARQLAPLLPVGSMADVERKLPELQLDGHRLPLAMFATHVAADLFPVANAEDLVRKLSQGVRHAITMAHAPNFPISHPVVRQLLATSLQGEAGLRTAIPVAYYRGPARLEPSTKQGE